MKAGLCWLLVACALPLAGGDAKLPLEESSNEFVDVSCHLILGKDSVQQALGVNSLPKGAESLILVSVKVRPLTDKPVPVSLDEFTLLSSRDGQHTEALSPTEVAGDTMLVLKQKGPKEGGLMAQAGVPMWGTLSGVGVTPATVNVDSKVETKQNAQDESLLKILESKVLPEKPISETTSGLLYFEIDGKVKPKDLSLIYRGEGGKLEMRFNPK